MNKFITFDSDTFELKAKLQLDPIKEVGINGAQIDDIILFAKEFIEGLNNMLPCRENSITITKLEEALMWLKKRKEDREEREVEGLNKL